VWKTEWTCIPYHNPRTVSTVSPISCTLSTLPCPPFLTTLFWPASVFWENNFSRTQKIQVEGGSLTPWHGDSTEGETENLGRLDKLWVAGLLPDWISPERDITVLEEPEGNGHGSHYPWQFGPSDQGIHEWIPEWTLCRGSGYFLEIIGKCWIVFVDILGRMFGCVWNVNTVAQIRVRVRKSR
jgi:hypothetical protein